MQIWDKPDPVRMSVFNVNYSQTRIAMPPADAQSALTHPPHACRTSLRHMSWCTVLTQPSHACRTSLRHMSWCTVLRKSRLVSVVEMLLRAVDEYCAGRLDAIQKAKERLALEFKAKARLMFRVATRTCMCMYDIGCVHECTHGVWIARRLSRMLDLPE